MPANDTSSLDTTRDIGAAGVGAQAGGELAGGVAALYAAKANQSILNFNARLDRYKAIAADNRGLFQMNQINRQSTQVQAQQKTGEAANGTVIGAGTNATVTASTQGVAAQDQIQARNNALMQAWGYNTEAANDEMEGAMAARAGKQALIGSAFAAAGTGGTGMFRLSQ